MTDDFIVIVYPVGSHRSVAVAEKLHNNKHLLVDLNLSSSSKIRVNC